MICPAKGKPEDGGAHENVAGKLNEILNQDAYGGKSQHVASGDGSQQNIKAEPPCQPRGGVLFALRRLFRQPRVTSTLLKPNRKTFVTIPAITFPMTTANSTTTRAPTRLGNALMICQHVTAGLVTASS